MTAVQLIRQGEEKLASAGVEEAKQDAWLLFSFVTGYDRTKYFLNRDSEIYPLQEQKYEELIDRRGKRIPLQYLTKEAYFMGHHFYVDENVLIPRQDTEVLVERASKLVREGDWILDMCTGSGCIILSLLLETKAGSAVASDVSKEALAVARRNAGLLQVDNIEFVQGDLFENIEGQFDMIVSNPPYIRTAVVEELMPEVLEHEPRLALDGHEDGLYFYRKITSNALNYLKRDGYLCCEIGYDQGTQVKELLESAGFAEVFVYQDLAGLDRVVIGKRR